MATIESNAVKKEDVSRETSEEKPVEIELKEEAVEKTEEKPQETSEEQPDKKDDGKTSSSEYLYLTVVCSKLNSCGDMVLGNLKRTRDFV